MACEDRGHVNTQMTNLQERTRAKGVCGNGEGGIGHEGDHKDVIWCDDGEVTILKMEPNDKYYTF